MGSYCCVASLGGSHRVFGPYHTDQGRQTTGKSYCVVASETGSEKLTGVDGITAASLKSEAPGVAKKVIVGIDKILK